MASLPVELRRTSVADDVRTWVQRETGAKVVRAVRLPGASSSAVHRLTMSSGPPLVLRRYAWPGLLENEPDAPCREVDALRFARSHGLMVPEVVAADVTGSAVRDGVPALLMTLLPGQPVAVPDPRRLAECAASIHAVAADELGHGYFRWCESEMTSPPALSTRPVMWERAIDLWHNVRPSYRSTFIHRDFHPGNLLWSRSRLTGIVDWVDACCGPAGCDIAHCRANLRDLAGPHEADAFVAAYESLMGDVLDPYWVLARHLEHDRVHWTMGRLQADEDDLAHAVQLLTA